MTLTAELQNGADAGRTEVALHLDDEGLEFLIQKLMRLRGRRDHEHLMTPAWAGYELTEEKQGDDTWVLINHLCLVKY